MLAAIVTLRQKPHERENLRRSLPNWHTCFLTRCANLRQIAGERKTVADEDRDEHYSERRFERVVRLPKQFDLDSVSAELVNGVLNVTIAKTPEAQPKRIDVK